MTYILRDYQQRAVEKAVWSMQLPGNDLLVMATGAGKSLIIAETASRIGQDVCIFQPNKEIMVQNIAKLKAFVSEWEVGVYSASMSSRTVRRYTFVTIGSVYKRPDLFAHFGVFLIDEVHQVNPKNLGSMFTTFINQVNRIRAGNGLPHVKIIGLTATPYRNVLGYHKDERGDLIAGVTLKLINRMKPDAKTPCMWERILINVGIGDLMSQGYLCPLTYEDRSFLTQEQMKLNKSGTEFDQDNFAVKLGAKQQQVIECVLDAQKRFKRVLVFCPSVSAANKFSSVVEGSKAISAKTDPRERDRIGRDFGSGRLQTVFNVGVYTTGADFPELDCIINLRPTRSMALWVQMMGRAVRIAPGKTVATIIDWTDTVNKLGKIETVELRKEKFPEFQSPMWEIFSITANGEERWHNRLLYSFKVKPSGKSGIVQRKIEEKEKKQGGFF